MTVLFNLVNPIPRNTFRCFSGLPIILFTSVIFNFSAIYPSPNILPPNMGIKPDDLFKVPLQAFPVSKRPAYGSEADKVLPV